MIIPYSRKSIKNSASYYSDSFLQNQKSKMNNNNNNYNDNNNTYSYSDKVAINSLDIADGLKELLTEHGFTLEELLNISSSELAESLGIDKYIAQIIESAVAKLSNNDNYASYHRLNANFANR
jgi:N-acetylglucosamine-6-phosphate deacetylase